MYPPPLFSRGQETFHEFVALLVLGGQAVGPLGLVSQQDHVVTVDVVHPEIAVPFVAQFPDDVLGQGLGLVPGQFAALLHLVDGFEQTDNSLHLVLGQTVEIVAKGRFESLVAAFLDLFDIDVERVPEGAGQDETYGHESAADFDLDTAHGQPPLRKRVFKRFGKRASRTTGESRQRTADKEKGVSRGIAGWACLPQHSRAAESPGCGVCQGVAMGTHLWQKFTKNGSRHRFFEYLGPPLNSHSVPSYGVLPAHLQVPYGLYTTIVFIQSRLYIPMNTNDVSGCSRLNQHRRTG